MPKEVILENIPDNGDNIENLSSVELEEAMKNRFVNMNDVGEHVSRLAGRILTIIDASISDRQQNKAMKDLIKQEVGKTLDVLHELEEKK
jgi:hypothetical protein